MSEKINSKLEIHLTLMRWFMAACAVLIVLFITFMIQTRSDLATIKATLATTENITTLEKKIAALDIKFHNELGAFLTISSYIAIEAQRTITLADVLYDFGRDVNVKDEELERFRNTVIFKMNNNVKLGTVRENGIR